MNSKAAITPMKGIKTGADPELFVFNSRGKAVSAHGLLPGTKCKPHPVACGAIQVDGMAAEFNINPATTFEEFDHNFNTVLAELKAYLPKSYSLKALPSVVFDQDVWDKTDDNAKELGCSPDFNAWTGEVNAPPLCLENPTLRTASGHLHIGWTEGADMEDLNHILNCQDLVKQLDWYLGAWSLTKDPDPTRRLLYGKAGACRYKSYGVEYRVLGNFWVLDKQLRLETWNRLHTAINDMAPLFMPERYKLWNNDVVNAINRSDLGIALPAYFPFPIKTI